MKRLCHKNIILRFTQRSTLGRSHIYAAFVTRFSCRASILSNTWESIQERGHTNVESVNRLFIKKCHLEIHWRIHTRVKPWLWNHWARLSCRSRIAGLNSSWENTQGRDHANIVYTLGRSNIYATIITIFFSENQFWTSLAESYRSGSAPSM